MDEKIYVMHHAPMSKRKGEIIGSRTDSGLNEYGIEVAYRQAERIKKMIGAFAIENMDYIISSPLKRAIQTSEIIAEKCKLDIIVDDRLKAQDFGLLDGMTFDEIYKDDILKLNLWDYVAPNDRDNHHVPGGAESNHEMVKRVNGFKNDMLSRNSRHSPLIITHGTVIDSLIAVIENKRLDEVEGENRRYEGRPIVFTEYAYKPIGKSGDIFDFIPGVPELLLESDSSKIINCVRQYLISQNVSNNERIHIEKLLTFYK